ncbi:MAG TPA: GNAT family protein [Gemmatimonadota bacterium]|nr:GNAT family protein [Gemmatimonadota bacterium]
MPQLSIDPDLTIPFEGGALRPWREGDAVELVRLANDRAVWRNLGDRFPHPYTPKDAAWWLSEGCRSNHQMSLAVELDHGLAGGLGFKFWTDPIFRITSEVGYWLGREHWGRGTMTRALCAAVPWALERYDLVRIEAGVFETNPASGRVLEKAGFRLEARLERSVIKDGVVLDRLLYVRFRS